MSFPFQYYKFGISTVMLTLYVRQLKCTKIVSQYPILKFIPSVIFKWCRFISCCHLTFEIQIQGNVWSFQIDHNTRLLFLKTKPREREKRKGHLGHTYLLCTGNDPLLATEIHLSSSICSASILQCTLVLIKTTIQTKPYHARHWISWTMSTQSEKSGNFGTFLFLTVIF